MQCFVSGDLCAHCIVQSEVSAKSIKLNLCVRCTTCKRLDKTARRWECVGKPACHCMEGRSAGAFHTLTFKKCRIGSAISPSHQLSICRCGNQHGGKWYRKQLGQLMLALHYNRATDGSVEHVSEPLGTLILKPNLESAPSGVCQ